MSGTLSPVWLDLLKYLEIHGSSFAGSMLQGGPRHISCEAQGCLPALLWLLDNNVGTQEGPQGGTGTSRGRGFSVSSTSGCEGYSCLQPGFLFLVFSYPLRGRFRKWSSGQFCPRDTAGSGVTWGGHIRDGIGTRHTEARAAARMHRTGPAKAHLVPMSAEQALGKPGPEAGGLGSTLHGAGPQAAA